jgi:oxygen-independent coproporphyrinogen-3 oxidase
MTGLYIHVPLCLARCRYCDFYKLTPAEWDGIDGYIRCLEMEMMRLPAGLAPDTVFIGGGTPTALAPDQLEALLEALARQIDLSGAGEFSCEANPGTLTPEKLRILRDGGVNRMSIGIQTFDNRALRLLGRIHDARQGHEAFRLLREAGFENINIDLIQSIPGMTREAVLEDARQAVALQPEHLSYYNLIYEPNTPLTHDRDAGLVIPPGDEQEADTYYAVKALLESAGYPQYEISNFCRPGMECRHNLIYWRGGDYFGCGPSAHSHWKGARFGNVPDVQDYCRRLQAGRRPFDEMERLDPDAKAREILVMWLRLTDGVDLCAFERLTGRSVDALCGTEVARLVEEGLLLRTGSRLALTEQALFVCNAVMSELV